MTWCCKFLIYLVKKWNWDLERLRILDNCVNWQLIQARNTQKERLETIMQNEKLLKNFTHNNKLSLLIINDN
ncbi:MAG: class I adenylate cyclase [Candidatus Baumannia cicadellinicola]|nr:class I adenylate cyclase [Candidatus Baumannia cicadellinicola]